LVLAIDIGTSNFKAALIEYDGSLKAACKVPLEISLNDGERHEADASVWLRSFFRAVFTLSVRAGEGLDVLKKITTIAVCGNGPTLVPVTGAPSMKNGHLHLPSGPARLWLDRRGKAEAVFVSELVGDFVDAGFFVPKALALKNQEPRLYEKSRYFLSPGEFLAYALTGEARTVFPSAGFERWYWEVGLLERAGLDSEKFPPFVEPGAVIGELCAKVREFYGFSRGVRIIAGGPDFFMSILGTGCVRPGDGCDRSGTSEGVNVCTKERVVDKRLMSYGHPSKPFWNLSGIISTSGKAISWSKKLIGMKDKQYGEYYDVAASAPEGAGGVLFLPYLAGERAPIWDSAARGVFFGLNLETQEAALARSVCEGVCFAVKDVVGVMEDAGAEVKALRVTGGPSESEFLNQLKADVLQKLVLLPLHSEAELVGLTVLAGVGAGEFANTAEAVGAIVKIKKEFTPHAENASFYADRFYKYREIYQNLKGSF
jgi:xylulokinase